MINDKVLNTGRGGRAMTEDELNAFLPTVSYGTMAYISEEGWPDMRPMNFGYYNGAFYFHTSKRHGEKLKNLVTGKRITLNFYDVSDRVGKDFIVSNNSVLVYGTLERLDTDMSRLEEMKGGLKAMCDSADLAFKALGDKLEKCIPGIAVFKINPVHISGKIVCFSSTPEEHKKI